MRLQFKLTNGEQLRGSFPPEASLQEVCHYLDTHRTGKAPGADGLAVGGGVVSGAGGGWVGMVDGAGWWWEGGSRALGAACSCLEL